jgi:predicted PurR-regulated permease PerM
MSIVKLPFYAKASLIFIGIISFIGTLYIGKSIIVPIIYATILATVLSPLVIFLENKGLNRVWAIIISLLVMLVTLSMLGMFFYSQMDMFTQTFPKLVEKVSNALTRLVNWSSDHYNVSPKRLKGTISEMEAEIMNYGKSSIGATLSVFGDILTLTLLIPVYIFMILFYEPLLLDFIRKLFGKSNQTEVESIMVSTKFIIQKYLSALMLEAIIVATMNSVALLFIGVEYAIVLGVMGAIINIIPYIGGIISIALPIIVAMATMPSASYSLIILIAYLVIQFIDVHYIVPKIVASKVRLNALVSIIAVLTGGTIWGVPGMFLSIPLTAVLKVIFDHIEGLKPWGFLLGDTMPAIRVMKLKTKDKDKEVQVTV